MEIMLRICSSHIHQVGASLLKRSVRDGNLLHGIRNLSYSWNDYLSSTGDRPTWTQEWKDLGLGCELVDHDEEGMNNVITNLLFVQVGFGVDQHGEDDATKAATRAVRNAIEFNSIPGVIEVIPGGRKEMLIQVKLGIPTSTGSPSSSSYSRNGRSSSTMTPTMRVDPLQIAKVFPYGRLLPIEMVVGGLSFSTGRLVPELGDTDDLAVCVAACVSIGYDNNNNQSSRSTISSSSNAADASSPSHIIYSTRDGY